MKKILCTLFIAFLLCGCAAKNQKGEDQSEQVKSEQKDNTSVEDAVFFIMDCIETYTFDPLSGRFDP